MLLPPLALACGGQILVAIVGLATRWNRRVLVHAITYSLLLQALGIGWAVAAIHGLLPAAVLFILIATMGLAVEKCGLVFGIPFGRYRYTAALRPKLLGVPLQIAVAWWTLAIPAFVIARTIAVHPVARILIAAQLVAALDLFIDPAFVQLRFWRWERRGIVFGIPLVNYLGWFATAAVMYAATNALIPQFIADPSPSRTALILIYLLNVALQSGATLFLWPWRQPRIVLLAFPLLMWPLALLLLRQAG